MCNSHWRCVHATGSAAMFKTGHLGAALLLLSMLHPSWCVRFPRRSNEDALHRRLGPLQCRPDDPMTGALDIFTGWTDRASACLKAIESKTCDDKGHGLAMLRLWKRLCAYKFTYEGGSFTYDASGHESCDHAALRDRAGVLLIVLNYLIENPPTKTVAVRQLPKFSFYYFPRDGSPTDDALRCHLGLPALVAGISHSDKCGLPVPHPHLLMALVVHYGLGNILNAHLGGNDGATQAGAIFLSMYRHSQNQPFVPWPDRIPKLVYRGTCTVAHDPDVATIGGWVNVRPQLCNISATAGIAEKYIDVGIVMKESPADWQEPCRVCAKPHVSYEQWMPARYQMVAEGYGPSYEATDIKLSSGGVVIWPLFKGYQDHLYFTWYQPLLQAGYNYFQPTIEEVGPLVLACERHLQRQCMQVALRAHHTYNCKVTFDSAGIYLLKLMESFSRWQRKD